MMINTHNHAHADQSKRIAELEQEVKVLNAQIKAMKPFLIYEECNTDFRRIAENEVK